MKATAYLKTQIDSARYLLDAVLKSLNDEQLAWSPPGTLETIGTIWLHTIAAEDAFISILSQQDKLWDIEEWQEIFGPKPGRCPDLKMASGRCQSGGFGICRNGLYGSGNSTTVILFN